MSGYVNVFLRAWVPKVVGLLLVITGLSKGLSVWLGISTSRFPLLKDPWLAVLLGEFEFLLGCWLVLGIAAHWARWTAIACFAVFALVSIWLIWIGQVNCGCFGPWRASPRLALVVDVAALMALAIHEPMEDGWGTARLEGDVLDKR